MIDTFQFQTLLPALVMFTITVTCVSLLLLPAIRFPRQSKLVNFYWRGFWFYLAAIAAFAGGKSVMNMLGYDVNLFASSVLRGLQVTFVIFVVFGWARLSLTGLARLTQNMLAARS